MIASRLLCATLIALVMIVASVQNSVADDESSALDNIDFANDVLPLLTKAGCNSGACHGAAVGRGGFRLSLYGQDAPRDWVSVARELRGRRVDTTQPERSLLLRKAGEIIEHGGGLRIAPESEQWNLLTRWIAAGAPRTSASPTPTLVAIEATLEPVGDVEQSIGIKGRQASADGYRVLTKGVFSNDTTKDMSRSAIVSSLDPGSVEIDAQGFVRAARPGRHVLIVRVRDRVTACELLAPFNQVSINQPSASAYAHFIDRAIDGRLSELGLSAAGQADSQTLTRRLTLDLLGRLPRRDELAEIPSMLPGSKTAGESSHQEDFGRLWNRISQDVAFIEFWTHWLATELRIEEIAARGGADRAIAFRRYLRDQLSAGVAVPEILASLVEADGPIEQSPAGTFYLLAADGRGQAEVFSELALGSRIACANCHDHPLDKWTQDDYHGLAAVFAGVRRGNTITWKPGATNTHPRTGDAAEGRLPDGQPIDLTTDPRPILANWIRGAGRREVARSWANRVWAQLFGSGLVDPVDDARVTNPPSHPELLDELTNCWMNEGEDLRWLIREIISSQAYQRQATNALGTGTDLSNQLLQSNYGMRRAKILNSAVWLDAISDVTGVRELEPVRTANPLRYIERADLVTSNTGAMPQKGCEPSGYCPIDLADSLAGRLALMNGPLINDRLTDANSRVTQWSKQAESDAAETVIDEIFMTCFARAATKEELRLWSERMQATKSKRELIEDMLWSMLTSPHFGMNW